jgi:hypothetical protein
MFLQGTTDTVKALQNALLDCIKKLRPTDYVCFNIGNAKEFLVCDKQLNME